MKKLTKALTAQMDDALREVYDLRQELMVLQHRIDRINLRFGELHALMEIYYMLIKER